MKKFLRFLVNWLFGFRAYNVESLNTPGPVLLIPNHVSWVDWLFLAVCLEDDWRFVTSSAVSKTSWFHRKVMVNRRTFPIDPGSPYAVKHMAEHLRAGGRLVLFAEGRLSRTGTLMKLFDGTGFLLFKTRAQVITAYLRGANRLQWVGHTGWTCWFPTVTAHFSDPLTPPHPENLSTALARAKLTAWVRDQLIQHQFEVEMEHGSADILSAVAQMARRLPKRVVLEDATRQKLTYRRLMLGSALLAEALAGRLRTVASQERVGVLMPNVNATPVLLLSLWRVGVIPGVLNFSTGMPTMLACAQLAGFKQIITSRAFLDRARIKPEPLTEAGLELIYLEDLRASIGLAQKLAAALRLVFSPMPDRSPAPGDVAVTLFTSGSEGVPKGVELTHRNLLANIRQMLAVTDLSDDDRIFNCLPLFHSFGLTVGTLLPLVRGMYCFIYPSPLHYRVVPSGFYEKDCTVFLSTNTFLAGYARKAHPYDFRSLRYLFAAAEKLQDTTATLWAQRFGVRVLEGYGATECSPCVSVNTPLSPRHGSVGRILPGMEFKLESVEDIADGGRLLVRGPNIMHGYLNPDANAAFKALDGWYDTGDIVKVDEDGYLHILGRLKRFAKVSGEMVSLTAVEEALAGAFPQYGLRCQVAVVTRPDEHKGEALIAVTNESKMTIEEIRAVIQAKGLPNLCVPREIQYLREIPKLGTGKTNHRELQRLVLEKKENP